jgi:hypothetical protein
VYAGYLGGNGRDAGLDIAVDNAGNAYVTGITDSPNTTFPVTVGPDLTYNGGETDTFVAKVHADGTALLYVTYLGGNGIDQGNGIAVDSNGNAYVTGITDSSQATFPEKGGPALTYNGGFDAFVAKINATGTNLVYAGYIGGASLDVGADIAVDSGGNAYVTGTTVSPQATFPEKGGPDLTYNGGEADAFVAKVRADGTTLIYAGYLGGNSRDQGNGVAVDTAGNAYVTGSTKSSQATFPEKGGPDLTYNGGQADAFVAKVRADGTALIYAGYLGGSVREVGTDIAVDTAGNAYITGNTDSQTTFPVIGGPDLTYNGGEADAFVAKINAAGTALVYTGYLGGSGGDFGNGIAVDTAGNAYVTGNTNSSQATFPEKGGPDLTYNGGSDAFVVKVNAAGTGLVYAGYLGGNGIEQGVGIAVDHNGNAYVTGLTSSTAVTFPEIKGPDLIYNGGEADVFVVKVH